ncbi:MAG: IclR family transcriptional regulator [Oscillospiraceae bacterium]|nr:IclR family transcriptional regulator [Oscillospiraceae bacterium]
MPQPAIQSVVRAISILRCFEGDAHLSLAEISCMVGLHKSTAAGIINTLKAEGFLEQDPVTSKLRLGLELFSLAVQARRGIVDICDPFLNELLSLTNETVNLAVLDKNEIVYIAKKESTHSIRISTNVGKHLPLHCTAIGKSILACMHRPSAEAIIDNLEFRPYTEHTITDKTRLINEIDRVMLEGVAYDHQEFQIGVSCVAAPLYYQKFNPIAAISVSGPSFRIDDAKRKKIAAVVMEIAAKICHELARVG